MAPTSYLIVGSGVFGASTALSLVRKYPNAKIQLVDRNDFKAPTRVAASWDWNKVVRADYLEIEYTKMALEAQDLWRSDPVFKPFYHESGIYWISKTGFAEQVLRNFEKLGVKAELYSYAVDEARRQYGGIFDDADYTDIRNVLINKSSGWADAKEALQRTIEEAVSLGVEYITAEVVKLDLAQGEASGACRGVITADGRVITADRTILSTGAYTAPLLLASAPARKDLHAGGRLIAAAVAEGKAPLTDKQATVFKSAPVAIQENPPNKGGSNGCLPPSHETALKYWGQYVYRNTIKHESGQEISMPPQGEDYCQWKVPDLIKNDVRFSNTAIFGKTGESLELENFRLCWDAVTPSADFIISPHTACPDLYVATCGSFHGWKFLPVLGKYVVEMLDGKLDAELAKKWAWDRDLPSPDSNTFWPRQELRDFSEGRVE